MKPRVKLAEANCADGGVIALYEHDGAYSINIRGQELMHSKACASELLLGKLGTEKLERDQPARVLVGGLGLGFTLRSVLESIGETARVEVVELIPEVVEWNRSYLLSLNGSLLDDARVTLVVEDATPLLRRALPESYDVILLDVDNGPVAMVAGSNASLYSKSGLRTIRSALSPRGRAVFWSAGPDRAFEGRLKKAGFDVAAVPAKVHESARRAAYLLYVADKIADTESPSSP